MTTYDPAGDGAQMSFDGRMSYGDYLQIDRILTSQHLLTGAQRPVRARPASSKALRSGAG